MEKINDIIIGKPRYEKYYEEYKDQYLKVIRDEAKRDDLPIMYNLNFGHTFPIFILPYGVEAEIDCDNKKFKIIEACPVNAIKQNNFNRQKCIDRHENLNLSHSCEICARICPIGEKPKNS